VLTSYHDFSLHHVAERHRSRYNNYRYVLRSGVYAHHAFHTEEECAGFLRVLRLALELPVEGASSFAPNARYYTSMEWERPEQDGQQVRWLSNGEYTLGVVAQNGAGVCTVHFANPNVRDREHFDMASTRRRVEAGVYDAYPLEPAEAVARAEREHVLAFCREHDWGRNAYLWGTQVAGLVERVYDPKTLTGRTTYVTREATMRVVRHFGGY
jgi:hypothetical protein